MTLRFGPAVSQKGLENSDEYEYWRHALPELHEMKARIEIVADFEDLKRNAAILKESARKQY
jgi:hypothetical protein